MTDVFGPEVKVGDEVCMVREDRWHPGTIHMQAGVIERITGQHVLALHGRRWLRRNGVECGVGGSNYDRDRLSYLTDDLREQAALSVAIRKAVSTCRRAAALLEKARGEDAVRLEALLPDELIGAKA